MKQKNTRAHLEKIVTLAGLAVITVGCIANLYSAYTNQRFIHDPVDYIYYLRYIILLGGGFAVGYMLARKKSTRYSRLFAGVFYAVLAMAIFWLLFPARSGLQNLFGEPSYPWGKILFMGLPLLSIIIVVIITYFSQNKSNSSGVSTLAKVAMISSFVVYEVYTLISGVYFLITGTSTYSPNTSIWLIIVSYLVIPLVIAFISYLVLNNVKKRFDRLFFAALIGVLYSTFVSVLWEFRIDASEEATNIFSSIVIALAILLTGILLWQARKVVK